MSFSAPSVNYEKHKLFIPFNKGERYENGELAEILSRLLTRLGRFMLEQLELKISDVRCFELAWTAECATKFDSVYFTKVRFDWSDSEKTLCRLTPEQVPPHIGTLELCGALDHHRPLFSPSATFRDSRPSKRLVLTIGPNYHHYHHESSQIVLYDHIGAILRTSNLETLVIINQEQMQLPLCIDERCFAASDSASLSLKKLAIEIVLAPIVTRDTLLEHLINLSSVRLFGKFPALLLHHLRAFESLVLIDAGHSGCFMPPPMQLARFSTLRSAYALSSDRADDDDGLRPLEGRHISTFVAFSSIERPRNSIKAKKQGQLLASKRLAPKLVTMLRHIGVTENDRLVSIIKTMFPVELNLCTHSDLERLVPRFNV